MYDRSKEIAKQNAKMKIYVALGKIEQKKIQCFNSAILGIDFSKVIRYKIKNEAIIK